MTAATHRRPRVGKAPLLRPALRLPPRTPSSVPPSDRLRAKDVAALESCSPCTAGRLMRSGALGPVHGRNRRDRWVDRHAYLTWLDMPANPAEHGVCPTYTGRAAARNGVPAA